MAKCVKVEKRDAQKLKSLLLERGLLDRAYSPESFGGFVYFPVKGEVEGHKLVERKLSTTNAKPKSLSEALSGKLPKGDIEKIVTSFDLLGELAIIEVPAELSGKEREIGKAVMEVHPSVKTVAVKRGPMEGEFRVRKLEVIAGKKGTETTYKESGCSMLLDPAKVYFSPRLSFERERAARLVGENNDRNVLVMFAGVGPFALVIAKKNPNALVAAVELNPSAFEYLVRNIKLNKLEGRVIPVFGDVRDAVPLLYSGWADRVLMPLPKGAEDFLDVAVGAGRRGAVVHVYTFARVGEEEKKAREVVEKAGKFGRRASLEAFRTVRPFAPHVDQISVDVKLD